MVERPPRHVVGAGLGSRRDLDRPLAVGGRIDARAAGCALSGRIEHVAIRAVVRDELESRAGPDLHRPAGLVTGAAQHHASDLRVGQERFETVLAAIDGHRALSFEQGGVALGPERERAVRVAGAGRAGHLRQLAAAFVHLDRDRILAQQVAHANGLAVVAVPDVGLQHALGYFGFGARFDRRRRHRRLGSRWLRCLGRRFRCSLAAGRRCEDGHDGRSPHDAEGPLVHGVLPEDDAARSLTRDGSPAVRGRQFSIGPCAGVLSRPAIAARVAPPRAPSSRLASGR